MGEIKEIKIRDRKIIDEIKTIQKYIREKGLAVTEIEIVQACIRLAKRLSAENWGVYLEVKRMHELKNVDAEITLDVLDYINKLGDEEKVDAQKISDELGYKKEKVEEVIDEIFKRSNQHGKN